MNRQKRFAFAARMACRILTAGLVLVLAFTVLSPAASASSSAEPTVGDLIHFIPTTVDVEDNAVTVYGYFINLNKNYRVSNFKEYEMDLYIDGELIISGEFGTINSFTVEPLGMVYQSFTFNGAHDLNVGSYVAGDDWYCVVGCSFSKASTY